MQRQVFKSKLNKMIEWYIFSVYLNFKYFVFSKMECILHIEYSNPLVFLEQFRTLKDRKVRKTGKTERPKIFSQRIA